MKIYTRTGDAGTTQLIGGERVAKCDNRVEAYGDVDELSAYTALLADTLAERHADVAGTRIGDLRRITARLMDVEALLACGAGDASRVAPFDEAETAWLEEQIDAMQATLPALRNFTLPGGNTAVSLCHVCRTVCRRAERAAVRASMEHPTDAAALHYLNRLSDYFYTLGRDLGAMLHAEEILWTPRS